MDKYCKDCKYGCDASPVGHKPSPGTVWCSKRNIQMAKNRQMPCFTPIKGALKPPCYECKRSRITKPSGESPQLGYIWCDKKHIELNKQRRMDCFEHGD